MRRCLSCVSWWGSYAEEAEPGSLHGCWSKSSPVYLVVFPVYAFQVSSSTTGYVRVASQAAVSSMVAAQRAATLSSVASLVSTSTAGSIGVRLVAGSLGWPALGIVAGITLAMLYYDATQTAQLKAAATRACAVVNPRVHQYLHRPHLSVGGE